MSAFRTIALDDIPAHHEEDTGADWLPLRDAFEVSGWERRQLTAEP